MVNLVENQGFVIVGSEVSHNAINCSRADNVVKKEMNRAHKINDSNSLESSEVVRAGYAKKALSGPSHLTGPRKMFPVVHP